MNNLSVTRFPGGVGDRAPRHPMASLPVFDPTKHVAFFDDFTSWTVAAAGVTGWHLAEAGTSVGAADVTDAHGGVVAFEADDVGGSRQMWQWAVNTDPIQAWRLGSGKAAWLRTRFKVESAATNLPMIGMAVPNDDPWDSSFTDSFRFETESGSDPDDFRFVVGATVASEQAIPLGNLADDTWITATAHYDPVKNTVFAWTEDDAGVVLAQGSQAAPDLPNAVLGTHFGCETIGTAGANLFSLDFIYFLMER